MHKQAGIYPVLHAYWWRWTEETKLSWKEWKHRMCLPVSQVRPINTVQLWLTEHFLTGTASELRFCNVPKGHSEFVTDFSVSRHQAKCEATIPPASKGSLPFQISPCLKHTESASPASCTPLFPGPHIWKAVTQMLCRPAKFEVAALTEK